MYYIVFLTKYTYVLYHTLALSMRLLACELLLTRPASPSREGRSFSVHFPDHGTNESCNVRTDERAQQRARKAAQC